MSDIEKVIQQMRQYVYREDSGHECRVSSHTITAWANTLEQALIRNETEIQKTLRKSAT